MRSARVVLGGLALVLVTAGAAWAAEVLHQFGGPGDGYYPAAGLINSSGSFYGTTNGGGTAGGFGTVFKSNGVNERVVYSFAGGSDGAGPSAPVVRDNHGNLYGTTYAGGGASACSGGCGTVFKITRDGTESVLYRFQGSSDGQNPASALYRDSNGNLYGTASGGANSAGVVFMVTPAGVEATLYAFCSASGCSDGGAPSGGLIADASGNLHGTTYFGAGGLGVVYELTPVSPGSSTYTEVVLYSFKGGSDGANPAGGVIEDANGNFFGVTQRGGSLTCMVASSPGCGTVFELTQAGVEAPLYAFQGGKDGSSPAAGLIADSLGNLYGATPAGGSSGCVNANTTGCGTVFRLAVPATPGGAWSESVLHRFQQASASDGGPPSGGLAWNDTQTELFGTTQVGGGTSCDGGVGCGTIFRVASH